MRTFWLLVIVLLGAGFAPAPDPADAPPVARVGDSAITQEAFRTYYRDVVLKTGQPDGLLLRRRVLSDLVGRVLLEREARQLGLDKTPAYRFQAEQTRRRLLLDRASMAWFYDRAEVTDDERAEVFARMHTQITARHLYAPTRAQAEALRARLDAGATFEALAREVFADSALATSGGFLGTFGFDEMDPAFEQAAFHLPIGEVSAPVQTATGFSIIRVEHRFTNPLLTESEFAKKKPHIDAYVRRSKALDARDAYLDAQRAALDARFTPAIETLHAWLDGAYVAPDRESFEATAVVTFGPPDRRRTWTVADVVAEARYLDPRSAMRVRSPEDLEALVVGLLVQQELLRAALEGGLDRDAAFRAAYHDAMTAHLVRERRAALTRVADVPEDSLKAAYARYGADMVRAPRVEVSEILVATLDEAREVRRMLEAGVPFEGLAASRSLRPGAAETGGSLGLVAREELGMLGAAVFGAAPESLLGPIEVAGRYAVLRVGARQEPRPMPYAEARPTLEAQYRERQGARQLRAHLQALRDAADVQVDHAVLAALSLYD